MFQHNGKRNEAAPIAGAARIGGTARISRGKVRLFGAVLIFTAMAVVAPAQRGVMVNQAPKGSVFVVAWEDGALGIGFGSALEQAARALGEAGLTVVGVPASGPDGLAGRIAALPPEQRAALGGVIEIAVSADEAGATGGRPAARIGIYHEPFPPLPPEHITSPEYSFKFASDSALLALVLRRTLAPPAAGQSDPLFRAVELHPADTADPLLPSDVRRRMVRLTISPRPSPDAPSAERLAEAVVAAIGAFRADEGCAVMGVLSDRARRHAAPREIEIRVYKHVFQTEDEKAPGDQPTPPRDAPTTPVTVVRPDAGGLYAVEGLEPLTAYRFEVINTAKAEGEFWRRVDEGRFVTSSLTGVVRTVPVVLADYRPLPAPAVQEPAPPAAPPAAKVFDVVIEGATVFDGTREGRRFVADVAIAGGRIAAVGDLKDRPRRETIAAAGLFLMPGFIDIHSHADSNILSVADAPSHTRQGITTVLGGNCSFSPLGLGGWLREVDKRGAPVNIAMLIGNRPVRERVMGARKGQPTYEEVYWMKLFVDLAMEEGAFGMSTGLIYSISEEAFTWELAELAKQMRPYGGFYASHIRGETDEALDAAREAVFIGELAGVPVQISHIKLINKRNWGRMGEYMQIIRKARERGLDVTGDQYPWRASGPAAHYQLHRLLVREAIENESPEVVLLKDMPEGRWAKYSGRPLSDLLTGEGLTAEQAVKALSLTPRSKLYATYLCLGEQDVRVPMREDFIMVCTDASLVDSAAIASGRVWDEHPRKFRTYPEFFARYVRDGGVCSWELGVYKCTGLPAKRLGLEDRGVIKPGAWADLVLLDPERLDPGADYRDQAPPPQGITHVFLNGVALLKDGVLRKERPGRALYHNAPPAARQSPAGL
ncbi:MAG: hypothetical protein Kow0059_21410 [Candidatus Sumerlaeia bacterium]